MPLLNSKQYVVIAKAGAKSLRAAPAVSDRRSLFIQNTGANPGLVRIGGDVRGDGGDILLAVGSQPLLWDTAETCPNEDINFLSVAGTTFAVIEGTKGHG